MCRSVTPTNLIAGAKDWNLNDGCAVNASFDGGQTWTATLPNGFIPGVTRFTNDPSVPGTGFFDAGGDPAVAFGPDGDRKSTRLNSSHGYISYAVFCLKKKKKTIDID